METPGKIGLALIIFLSAPAKPGAPHRLLASREFETRLAEFYVLSSLVADAYDYGVDIALGKRDAKSSGIGKAIASSITKSFEVTGETPLPGVHASILTLALLAGMAEKEGRRLESDLGMLVNRILYKTSSQDAIEVLEALEATACSTHIEHLDRAGIRKSSIATYGLSLGDLFEKLEEVDLGFSFNIRGYSKVLKAYRSALGAKSLTSAAIRVYLSVLEEHAGVKPKTLEPRSLLDLDSKLRSRGFRGWALAGLAAAATAMAFIEKPLPPA